MVIPTPTIQGERDFGAGQLEGTYKVGFEVDELKPHLTPTGKGCEVRRGTIVEILNHGLTGSIQCGYGTIVKESV